MNPELWEISHIYKIAIFKKITGENIYLNVFKRYYKLADDDDELYV